MVPKSPRFRPRTPSAGTAATVIGIGRLSIGAVFLADPVTSVRVLGVDSATAKRMAFLARMTAGRDIALGVGTLLARTPRAKAGWLAAGALADAVDAAAIGAGTKQGITGGPGAIGISAGATVAAALGLWAALGLRGRD